MSCSDRTPSVVEHPRTADAITAAIDDRHASAGFAPRGDDELRDALARIGGRFGEILVEHLNAAPQRHLEAFSAFLKGPTALPRPAEVVLTFTPVLARAPLDKPIEVPAYTAVASSGAEPVVFETATDLSVVRAQAVRAVIFDACRMVFGDVGSVLSMSGFDGPDLLTEATPFVPLTHLAAPAVLGVPHLWQVGVEVELTDAGVRPPGSTIEWGVCTADGFVPLIVDSDDTLQLSRSGVVVLTAPPQWPRQPIDGLDSFWLSFRLVHAGSALTDELAFVPPIVRRLAIFATMLVRDAPVAAAAHGVVPLDTSKDFFPFGERPRFGEVFLATAPAFASAGTQVTLHVRMTNPANLASGPLPPVLREGKPRVRWEMYTSRGWVGIEADDATESFTQSGDVTFGVPDDVAPGAFIGHTGAWVRAHLVAGHYGAPQTVDGITYPAAPSIAALRIDARARIGPRAPVRVVRVALLEAQRVDPAVTPSFDLFAAADAPGRALYLGLESHEARWEGRTLSIQVQPSASFARLVRRAQGVRAAAPRWQSRTAAGWHDCEVLDDQSMGLVRAGLLHLRFDAEPSLHSLVWLRAVWPVPVEVPALHRIAINAVRARQTVKVENEIAGSSTGRPGQVFHALRTPMVDEVVLQVLEHDSWVSWSCVPDLAASDSGDRHFTLDRITGQIAFGDGRYGRIPPSGTNNVRLRRYHVGGGRLGNRPAGTVAQLRTTVPYVDKVSNLEPAVGGQDAPDAAAKQRVAGAWLRHRDRAVCSDDYADLARAAAPEVARAYCHDACDLGEPSGSASPMAGIVSLVVVPNGDEPRPQPTSELLDQVQSYLDSRRPLGADLVVLGPSYVEVAVAARVACAVGESPHTVTAACRQRLEQFLHPLRGGSDGCGWAPGLRPHRSDLVALLGAVDGVKHVDTLRMDINEADGERPRSVDSLVCCGTVEVRA